MTLCLIDKLTKFYGSGAGRVQALHDIELTIEPGEFTVFQGPSGSGKTTLLNQVGCLDKPDGGRLLLQEQDTSALSSAALSALRARAIGFIFQSYNLIPVLTAQENVELALELGGFGGDAAARAKETLERVGLKGFEHRRPNALSGGQQQRVAIARALAKEPLLIIADEPTANLDSENGAAILDLMATLNRTLGTTFLFSSHDPEVVKRARRVITLRDGRVVSDERRSGSAGQPANGSNDAANNAAQAAQAAHP